MQIFAVIACAVSSALGIAAILSHRWPLQDVVFCMGTVWLIADLLVKGGFRRSYWKAFDIPLSQIYRDVKAGREPNLPKQGALERITSIGSSILMTVFFVLYFV